MKGSKYPGVKMVSPGVYLLRVKITDPRTGKTREVKQTVQAASVHDAAGQRSRLLDRSVKETGGRKTTLGDFARSWLKAKSGVVAETTLESYANSLGKHILPALGSYFYDSLGFIEVQSWINESLKLKNSAGKPMYSRRTVEDWFRVLRNMSRDAVVQLSLSRDPTMRIRFPETSWTDEDEEKDDVLSTEEFHRFLAAMKDRPASYTITLVLGLTGQRFCHASALKWGDIDWEARVIRFRRKQNRGQVGPISKRKPAPREVPMVPTLFDALKAHKARNEWLDRRESGEGRGITDDDYLFLSNKGTFKQPSSLCNAFDAAAKAAKIAKNVTPHSLRYGFNDMLRRSGIDPVSARSLTGHVTEQMQHHYSTVQLDDKRAAMERLDEHLKATKVPDGDEHGP